MGPGQGNTIVVKDGGSCRCWCCRPLMLLLLLLLLLLLQKRGSGTGKHHSSEGRRQLQLQLPLLVLSSADAAAAAAAALAVPALLLLLAAAAALVVPALLLLLLPCHQPASKTRNQQPDITSCSKKDCYCSKLTRNSKTPPNFVPKMAQNRNKKVPNVSSEILENPRESQTICPRKV